MGKKICAFCNQNLSTDMLFGVPLCGKCRDLYTDIVQGNKANGDEIDVSNATAQAADLFSRTCSVRGVSVKKLQSVPESSAAISVAHISEEVPTLADVPVTTVLTSPVEIKISSDRLRISKLVSFATGMVSGIASFITGCSVSNMYIGTSVWDARYGADFYTDIQNATAQATNNLRYLADISKAGLGGILIIFGIAMLCYFTPKFIEQLNP